MKNASLAIFHPRFVSSNALFGDAEFKRIPELPGVSVLDVEHATGCEPR